MGSWDAGMLGSWEAGRLGCLEAGRLGLVGAELGATRVIFWLGLLGGFEVGVMKSVRTWYSRWGRWGAGRSEGALEGQIEFTARFA